MSTKEADIFGSKFRVVDHAPKHTTDEFFHHEPVMERWVTGIREGDFVIDGGASQGNYTLSAVARGARAVAYEPEADHAAMLRANVDENGWGDSVIVREVGIWDGTPYPEGILKQMGMRLDMPTVRLDDEVGMFGLTPGQRVHLKLDIEGTELGALLGGKGLLETYHPRLLIEDHEAVSPSPDCAISRYPESIRSGERMRELLGGLGYKIDYVLWDISRRYWWCE